MEIEGTYTLQAAAEEVWRGLMDRQILLQALPNIESLEQIDASTFSLSIRVKYAPLKGLYRGRLTLHEVQPVERFRVHVEAEGGQGNIQGSAIIDLHANEETTIVTYKGMASLGKLVSLNAVFKGATKLFIQQYFTVLADQLRSQHEPPAAEAGEHHEGDHHQPIRLMSALQKERAIQFFAETEEQAAAPASMPLSQKIVRTLRLGANDPEQEQRWTTRVRRLGIASGLLFLVWIGTRLPKRTRIIRSS